MILDGKTLAREIAAATAARVSALARPVSFGALSVAPNAVSTQYLSVKARRAKEAGISMELLSLPEHTSEEAIAGAITELSSQHDAVIIQLPLPNTINTVALCDRIPAEKDADVLSRAGYEAFLSGTGVVPPVARAVERILRHADISPKGLGAVVIGQGKLVGRPVADLLRRLGASVTVLTNESPYFADFDKADIIVSGAGIPGMLTRDMLGPMPVLIDAGTSELDGAIVGDIDPACAQDALLYTPVPGGVGPVAVACLLENVVTLAERR